MCMEESRAAFKTRRMLRTYPISSRFFRSSLFPPFQRYQILCWRGYQLEIDAYYQLLLRRSKLGLLFVYFVFKVFQWHFGLNNRISTHSFPMQMHSVIVNMKRMHNRDLSKANEKWDHLTRQMIIDKQFLERGELARSTLDWKISSSNPTGSNWETLL